MTAVPPFLACAVLQVAAGKEMRAQLEARVAELQAKMSKTASELRDVEAALADERTEAAKVKEVRGMG